MRADDPGTLPIFAESIAICVFLWYNYNIVAILWNNTKEMQKWNAQIIQKYIPE